MATRWRLRSASCGECPGQRARDGADGGTRAATRAGGVRAGRSGSPDLPTPGFVVFEDELYELDARRLALGRRACRPGDAIRHARAGRVGHPVRRAPSGRPPENGCGSRYATGGTTTRSGASPGDVRATAARMDGTTPTVMPAGDLADPRRLPLPAVERTDGSAVPAGRPGPLAAITAVITFARSATGGRVVMIPMIGALISQNMPADHDRSSDDGPRHVLE